MSDIQFHPTRTLFIANLPWHLKQRQLNHYIKQNIPQCIEHVEAIVIPKKCLLILYLHVSMLVCSTCSSLISNA